MVDYSREVANGDIKGVITKGTQELNNVVKNSGAMDTIGSEAKKVIGEWAKPIGGQAWLKIVNPTPSTDSAKTADKPKTSAPTQPQQLAESKFIDKELKTLEGELKVTTPDFSIRSRRTIKLEGLGKYLDGLYYIKGNKYTLDESGINQTLTLLKNAFIDDLKPIKEHIKPIEVQKPVTPYKVTGGETMQSIAIKNSISVSSLLAVNKGLFPKVDLKTIDKELFTAEHTTGDLTNLQSDYKKFNASIPTLQRNLPDKLVPGMEISIPREPKVKVAQLSEYRQLMDSLSNSCNVDLGEDERFYKYWKARHIPYDPGYDYDYRGYYRSNMPLPTSGLRWSDYYRKPNNPVFTETSIYSTPEHPGGRWINNITYATFRPSAWMKKYPERIVELKAYFAKYETPRGNKLYLEEE